MEPSPAFTTDDLEAFVAAPRIAVVAYTKRDGMPSQFPIWYRYDNGRFLMQTSRTAAKTRALQRNGHACLTIQDDMPPYRAVLIDGDVTVTDAGVEDELGRWLATHYFGRIAGAEFQRMAREEYEKTGVVKVTFDPTRVRCFDNHRMIGLPLRLYQRIREWLPIPREWL